MKDLTIYLSVGEAESTHYHQKASSCATAAAMLWLLRGLDEKRANQTSHTFRYVAPDKNRSSALTSLTSMRPFCLLVALAVCVEAVRRELDPDERSAFADDRKKATLEAENVPALSKALYVAAYALLVVALQAAWPLLRDRVTRLYPAP